MTALEPRRASPRLAVAPVVLAALGVLLFGALGVWQLERRVGKLALIERGAARIHAEPVETPGPEQWPAMTREADEYRRVFVDGRFLPGRETKVRAVTDFGAGYWVMAPFRSAHGFVVLVNRGFIPSNQDASPEQTENDTRVVGLLRMSEPKGGFLRSNDPTHARWYSRDVAAIAAADGLAGVAPYFIDAQGPNSRGGPVAGLTVVAFPNNHLIYALTWFVLAGLCGGGIYVAFRDARLADVDKTLQRR